MSEEAQVEGGVVVTDMTNEDGAAGRSGEKEDDEGDFVSRARKGK